MAHRRRSLRRTKRGRRSVKGGNGGASGHGVAIYGTNQHAVGTGDNQIAFQKGGRRGGTILGDLALPAVFYTANKWKRGLAFRANRRKSSKRHRKIRGGATDAEMLAKASNALDNASSQQNTPAPGQSIPTAEQIVKV